MKTCQDQYSSNSLKSKQVRSGVCTYHSGTNIESACALMILPTSQHSELNMLAVKEYDKMR